MDIVFTLIIIISGIIFANGFRAKLNKNELLNLKKLWIYHLIFACYYCFFTFGDSIGYWKSAKLLTWEKFIFNISETKGTAFMHAINYFPANALDMSYFSNTILFSLFGFMGLAYFYVLTLQVIPFNSKFKKFNLFPLLFFLPNLHYWSVGIGKDTTLMFCIGAIIYGFYNKKLGLMGVGLVLSFFLRPHIVFFLMISLTLVSMLNSKQSLMLKFFVIGIVLGVTLVMLPTVIEFTQIEDVSAESFSKFSESKASLLSRAHTGSSVDISSYPLPIKVLTFLYRPSFFDINGVPAVLASFENLLLLVLSIKILRNKPLYTYKKAPFIIQLLIIFLFIGALAFSQSLGNLGIMLRMRNMFLPGMIIFILWGLSFQIQKKNEKLNLRKRK